LVQGGFKDFSIFKCPWHKHVPQKIFGSMDRPLRSPLKVAIILIFRGIFVQVWIFVLKRAKKAFSAGKALNKEHFK